MFKKINRLTKDKEFANVFKNGRSSYDKIMGVKAVATELNYNRFGIMISNKVSKKAVERNKIKRQIREAIKAQVNKMKPGRDIVIIVFPEALGKKYQDFVVSIGNNFKKLRLY